MLNPSRAIFWLIPAVVFLGGRTAEAQQCLYSWMQPFGEVPGLLGRMNQSPSAFLRASTTWDPDGPGGEPAWLVIGGSFKKAGNATSENIAAWDGSRWHSLGSGFPPIGSDSRTVNALTVFDGDLIAGGYGFVQRWNGTSWNDLDVHGISGQVLSLAIYNGDLVVGGNFGAYGVASNEIVARFDGVSWHSLGTGGSSERVWCLTTFNDELIAGGEFQSSLAGQSSPNIARWNGSEWRRMGFGAGTLGNHVYQLEVFNSQLVVRGDFSTAGETGARYIAIWTGTNWLAMPGLPSALSFTGMTIHDGRLYVTGVFSPFAPYTYAWDGTTWTNVLPNNQIGHASYFFYATSFQGELVVGAEKFSLPSGADSFGMARWDGSVWRPVGSGIYKAVRSLAVSNGDLILGGDFSAYIEDSAIANHVVRWDGAAWHAMGLGVGGSVKTLANHGNDLIAAGTFTTAGGGPASNIASWDGAGWAPLGGGVDGSVNTVAEYGDDLVAGGVFTNADGAPANHIAQWDGAGWQPLGSGVNNTVNAVVEYDGDLIAGGTFTAAGEAPANYIARWDGTNWQTLGNPTALNGSVNALAGYRGDLIAAGSFTTIDGVSVSRIARWNGTTWIPMGLGAFASPTALGTYYGELAAVFSSGGPNNSILTYIQFWNGSSWTEAMESLNDRAFAMTAFDGDLIVGGQFSGATYFDSKSLARWTRACDLGDMNCDGQVDRYDVMGFVNALLNATNLTVCASISANMNEDVNPDGTLAIDGLDIQLFVDLILAGS